MAYAAGLHDGAPRNNTIDGGVTDQSDAAVDDHLRAAGVEIIAAAAALIHDLPAGTSLAEGRAEALPLQALQHFPVRDAVLLRHHLMRAAIDRKGRGYGEQVLVLERDILVVEGIGRLRFLQAHDERRAALDQRHRRGARAETGRAAGR